MATDVSHGFLFNREERDDVDDDEIE